MKSVTSKKSQKNAQFSKSKYFPAKFKELLENAKKNAKAKEKGARKMLKIFFLQ